MDGVLTAARKEILGAIEGIEDPEPLGLKGTAVAELVGGGFLAE